MRRGSTPTITVSVGADLSEMDVNLAFEAGNLIVKTGSDLEIEVADGKTTITTTLTQEDTLSMTDGKDCRIQVRAYTSEGDVAMATTIGRIPVRGILEDGKLPHQEPEPESEPPILEM